MNLVKTFCLTKGARETFDQAQHGLSAQMPVGGKELVDAYLEIHETPNRWGQPNNFAEFMQTLTGSALVQQATYQIEPILAQILSGHRHWAQAAGKQERFIALDDIQYWYDPAVRKMWLRIIVFADDLSRLQISQKKFLADSGLGQNFRSINHDIDDTSHHIICLEQSKPVQYANYPLDELNKLSSFLKPFLWATVANAKPYRRYYAYLAPSGEQSSLVQQILSIYAMTYYLGSITRYRPHQYDNLMASKWGPRIQDFVTGQPAQFLYLMASEFAEQEVTKPAIL